MLTEQFLTDLFFHFLDAIQWKSVPELWTTPDGIKEEKLSLKKKFKNIPAITKHNCHLLLEEYVGNSYPKETLKGTLPKDMV